MDTETAAAALPDDLLAVVLGRLPARSLAASRCVCKAWHNLIDERRLLLRYLPHSVRGLFINYQDYGRCHFLSRPTAASSLEFHGPRRIDGKFDFIERERAHTWYEVLDHCNGLVFFLESDDQVLHVCNPATRWSARLPTCPAAGVIFYYDAWNWRRRAFLVFDPFVSREYKVLLSPAEPERKQMENNEACHLMDWPPLAWTSWHVFSSSTGRWEENVFLREGEAAGTAGDMLLHKYNWGVEPPCRYAAYWKGGLYVHWRGEFVSRLSLMDDKYRVIKLPLQLTECKKDGMKSFLGISEKGVYIAAIANDGLAKLRVWTLKETSDQMEWVPKNEANLEVNTHRWSENDDFDEAKYWTLDLQPKYRMKNQDVSVEQNVCWNSDDDNTIDDSGDRGVLPICQIPWVPSVQGGYFLE